MRPKLLKRLILVLTSALLAGGCVVHEQVAVRPAPPPCAGGVWVDGHYGPYGHWHPGHWRCPAPVVVVVTLDALSEPDYQVAWVHYPAVPDGEYS